MFLSLKTLYRKRTVIWPFYFYTIIRTLSDPVLFKTLESQIKRINFEFLYIDNAQLKMPYLIEQNEHLLVKNILQYQNLKILFSDLLDQIALIFV